MINYFAFEKIIVKYLSYLNFIYKNVKNNEIISLEQFFLHFNQSHIYSFMSKYQFPLLI